MDKLGIEPKLLLAQVVNFSIIFIMLKVLLYKPILDMLAKRKKKIEEGLAITENMQKEEEKLEVKKQKVLADARKDAQALIEEARTHAKEEEKTILEEAKVAAEEILEKGKTAAEREREMMEKEVKNETVKLAVTMAKRLLSESMTSELQHKVLAKHISEIEKL